MMDYTSIKNVSKEFMKMGKHYAQSETYVSYDTGKRVSGVGLEGRQLES